MVLDWARFRTGDGAPSAAFEAFAAQVFERWIRRNVEPPPTVYVLNGAGGDGGVEAFVELADASVIGLQAKWFQNNLGDSEVRQIAGSLARALSTYPRLVKYIVAMPINLTKGIPGKHGKSRLGGVERWDRLVATARQSRPTVEICRWGEHELLSELAQRGNDTLRAAWFEGDLNFAATQNCWRKVERELVRSVKYLPDMHAFGQIERIAERDLWRPTWVDRTRNAVEYAGQEIRAALESLKGFQSLAGDELPTELAQIVDDAMDALPPLAAYATMLTHALAAGPRLIAEEWLDMDALWKLRDELEEFKTKPRGVYTVEYGRVAERVGNARDRLCIIARNINETARPRLILGPPGCGKTHGAADLVRREVDSGTAAVLVVAKDFDSPGGAGAVLARALDLPGTPLSQLLDGLEALATVQQTRLTTGRGGFCRSVLVLDGPDESRHPDQWWRLISELVDELQSRPRVHLIVAARPEFMPEVRNMSDISVEHLTEDGGADLPALLAAYAQRFHVQMGHLPWLGWALRSPLEVRMFAEGFRDQVVTADQGASCNLLTLFRSKIARVETEARASAGLDSWSDRLGLATTVLALLAELGNEHDDRAVADADVVRSVADRDTEFTATRIRLTLRVLGQHGLVSEEVQWPSDLSPVRPEYRLATRHVSDFVLATTLAKATVTAIAIEHGRAVDFPVALRNRPAAATLFAAQLAEAGFFAVDVKWTHAPANLELIHANSLQLVPRRWAEQRKEEMAEWLTKTTALNRRLIEALVVPVARIPEHPLGPRLLDTALRRLSLCDRDPIWSVPEDLEGTGPWKACYNNILDRLTLSPIADRWDGMPLLFAWMCSSVVESRRTAARAALAHWGAKCLDEMAILLKHMSTVDDPQVVDDIAVAAFGATLGARVDDPALKDLARVTDEQFFALDAPAWTESIPVRHAGRGILERAALIYVGEFDEALLRARPPYAARGDWPLVDHEESPVDRSTYRKVVDGDLSWYVAKRCLDAFAVEARTARRNSSQQIDYRLLSAINEHLTCEPPALVARAAAKRAATTRATSGLGDPQSPLLSDQSAVTAEPAVTGGSAEVSIDTLQSWLIGPPVTADAPQTEEARKPVFSLEFQDFLANSARTSGLVDLTLVGARDGMVAHRIKTWGWSQAKFAHDDWNAPLDKVDHALTIKQGYRGTHGARSRICTFREKYVWAAVDRLAGAMADRLPVWDEHGGRWIRLTCLDGLGNGLPDPFPPPAGSETLEIEPHVQWLPLGDLPALVT